MTKSLGIELSDSMVRVAVVERKGKVTRIVGYFENVIPGDELERRVDEWDAAARATPHGKPIELARR